MKSWLIARDQALHSRCRHTAMRIQHCAAVSARDATAARLRLRRRGASLRTVQRVRARRFQPARLRLCALSRPPLCWLLRVSGAGTELPEARPQCRKSIRAAKLSTLFGWGRVGARRAGHL